MRYSQELMMAEPRPSGGLALAAILAGAAASCLSGIDKPTPPDMSATIARYQSPTGAFDASVATEAVARGREVIGIAVALGVARRVRNTLRHAFEALGEREEEVSGSTDFSEAERISALLEGEGTVEIHRICDGYDALPPDLDRDGALDLVANLTHRGLDPVLWGWVSRCRYSERGVAIELSSGWDFELGDMRVFVGNNYTLDNFGATSPMLFELDMRARIGEAAVPVTFDFRALPEPQGFEVAVPVNDGRVLLSFTAAEQLVRVRASNGKFTCDDEEGSCRGQDGTIVPF